MRRWAGGAMFTALLLGVLAALAGAAPASARIVTINMAFEDLLPGERRSDTARVALPRDARLVDVVVGEETTDPGAFAWDFELCPPRGECLPVTPASEGTLLGAGDHSLVVVVTLDDDAPALASSTLTGRLVFAAADDDGGLPPTGTTLTILGLASLLLATGLGLVVLAPGRSRSEVSRA